GEERARTPPPAAAPPPVSASPPPRARRAGPPWWVWLIAVVALALLGLFSGATFMVGSPAPSSGDVLASIAGSASLALLALGALAVLAAVIIAASALTARVRAPAPPKRAAEPKAAPAPAESTAPAPAAPAAPAGAANVFVSYASVDRAKVVPIVDGVKQNGQTVWIDQQEIAAGEGWAGEIVRAIKGAKGVLVMCSAAAFESDHVKRELYLADRYKKRLLPVFLEDASPPEDFEYFFAGVQWLRLHDTPEADRSKAVVQALGAA
ncbi:MAG: toll/interleukin-1 receptor domain-containing protein, partial [Hyphomonadaceae bacterium]|nr:toll/interleukin-1 receptor domain-containing protein [Hyphomonadaceae bacterium]